MSRSSITLSETSLLLFSHGSLLCGAGLALFDHAHRLRRRDVYHAVEVGYLNYSEPTFENTVERLVASGSRRIVIVPFFLVPGYFVTVSLPRKLDPIAAKYPGVEFLIADCLGFDQRLAHALIESAKTPIARDHWRDGLDVDPENCLVRDDCPIHGTAFCPAVRRSEGAAARHGGTITALPLAKKPATAMMVMVHGSPKPEANESMYQVVDLVRASKAFDFVNVGFMECNAPTIHDAADACVAAGATRVIAVPYFLHMGNHVASDLPDLLDAAQDRHLDVEFSMATYLGASADVTDILAERARKAIEDSVHRP